MTETEMTDTVADDPADDELPNMDKHAAFDLETERLRAANRPGAEGVDTRALLRGGLLGGAIPAGLDEELDELRVRHRRALRLWEAARGELRAARDAREAPERERVEAVESALRGGLAAPERPADEAATAEFERARAAARATKLGAERAMADLLDEARDRARWVEDDLVDSATAAIRGAEAEMLEAIREPITEAATVAAGARWRVQSVRALADGRGSMLGDGEPPSRVVVPIPQMIERPPERRARKPWAS